MKRGPTLQKLTSGSAGFQLWNQMQLYVWHQSNAKVIGLGMSTIMTGFSKAPKEEQKVERGSRDSFDLGGKVNTLCRQGRLDEAVHMLDILDQRQVQVYSDTYACLLQGCAKMKALADGKRVHAHLRQSGMEPDIVLGNTLVNMYAKCGSLLDARQVFDKMSLRDVVSWTAMISGYAQQGYSEEAYELFSLMQREGIKPNQVTFISVLNTCSGPEALKHGKEVHAHIVKAGFESDVRVGNTLISMYAKCRSVMDMEQVFCKMSDRNLVSWNAMIAGYGQNRHANKAFDFFRQMQKEGLKPDKVTYISMLNACVSILALEEGKQVHADIVKAGFETNVSVGNGLVSMYAKCGSIVDAYQVFYKSPKQDVVSWNAMIAGLVQHGYTEEAFQMFQQMQQEGVKPNKITFITILNACVSPPALEQGKQVHGQIIETGFESDVQVGSALVSMYVRCGDLVDASQVFSKMPKRSVVSWTAIITGYAKHGHCKEAFEFFWKMQKEGLKADKVTFISILGACAFPAALGQGKWIHSKIIKTGFESDIRVGNALVSMYAKCGSMVDAHQVFAKMPKRDVVSWTAIIAGCTEQGYGEEAFELFGQMQQEGVEPDKVTLICILKRCASPAVLGQGKGLHAHIVRAGFESDVYVGTSLVHMYAKCGSLVDARKMFEKMSRRDVISWNAMIAAYIQEGLTEEAFQLFRQMQLEGIAPDKVTFASILNTCGRIADLEHGKQVHAHIIEAGFESDVRVGNTLLSMYVKCGSLVDARQVFDNIPEQDVVSWNAMIAGYIQQGRSEEAFELFWQMQRVGMKPDKLTFVTILNACTSPAALEQGRRVHAHITEGGVEAIVCLGNALVNMYARCGSVVDACRVFDNMPSQNVVSWTAMIAGYAQHGHGEEALELFRRMQQEGVKPGQFTFASISNACASIAALNQGKQAPAHIAGLQADENIPK